MNTTDGPRVLAFAVDAAEPTLIRKMIEHDEMPPLKTLLSEGRWMSVKSPADIGSGAVWATFLTGEDPVVHGFYGEWCWEAEQMGIRRVTARQLTPFWKTLDENGTTVGVFDVPFMPLAGLSKGFEVSEWGPHELLEGRVQAAPERVASLVSNQVAHPLSYDRLDAAAPDDYENLQLLISASLDGIRLRGSLAKSLLTETQPHLSLIAFTEIHHAAHFLWHTVQPEHQVYVKQVFGSLRMAAAKRRSPTALKKVYYKTMPPTATQLLARPTMMPTYDWNRTRAFSLPSDQHGWIRLNLRGREARGLVPVKEYEGLCRELEQLIRFLTTEDGKLLAREVIRTAVRGQDALASRLPDLVVHWEDEVFRAPLRIKGSSVISQPVGRKYTGQHAPEGFCILRGAANFHQGDAMHAKDLHRVISKV